MYCINSNHVLCGIIGGSACYTCSRGAVVGCTHAADFEELLLRSLSERRRGERSPEGEFVLVYPIRTSLIFSS